MLQVATKKQLDEILKLAAERKCEILESRSVYPSGRTTYYVDSENGCDNNDGLTPETAWKTLGRVTNTELGFGSVVLFRRGQIFRGTMQTQAGVTYSAFGEGAKPELHGSIDASKPSDWEKTECNNVWRYKEPIAYTNDIGAIFMKNDTLWGIKVCVNLVTGERCDMGRNGVSDVFNGRTKVHREPKKWNGIHDLNGDLEFWHDWKSGYLYLCCPDGNPAEAFGSVHFTPRVSIITPREWGQKDVTLDNLFLKYGNFGISGFGDSKNFTVRNCVFGCIGGAAQFPELYDETLGKPPISPNIARLGNGAEVYGVCEDFLVENCYFYQNYDAAVTVQVGYEVAERDFVNINTRWVNNLFDTCHYCFELWLTIADSNGFRHELNNTNISDNICLNCGYGWAQQRPDPGYAFYYGGSEPSSFADFNNCNLNNNYFVNGKGAIISAWHVGGSKMKFFDNKIYHNNLFGSFKENFDESAHTLTSFSMCEKDIKIINDSGFIGQNEYYTIAESDIPEGNIIKF